MPTFSFAALLTLAAAFGCVAATSTAQNNSICFAIQDAISAQSVVAFPGQVQYTQDQAHYFNSSTQTSLCTVEPGSASDVSRIIKLLGDAREPFAIKGGGHTGNPGFSSSPGVLISLSRFDAVTYHASNQTVDIGVGLLWEEVYQQLEVHNRTVVGGRIPGIGVAGLTLGGGYSWLSNEYGLVVDTAVGFEVVLPSGEIVQASTESNPDLFFALKGGFNNFGIVTQITLQTVPIGQVWGGISIATGDQLNASVAALNGFVATVTDPKAAIIVSFVTIPGELLVTMELFYNGPTPPPGVFDAFVAIPAVEQDLQTRSYLSLVLAQPAGPNAGPTTRGFFNTAAISAPTPPIVDAIVNETIFWSNQLANVSAANIAYAIEVFLPSVLGHAPEGSSAYPPTRSTGILPLTINYQFASATDDALVSSAIVSSAAQLGRVAEALGQPVDEVPVYGNYATPGSFSADRVFGASLPRLTNVQKKFDPRGVMRLTGGWKV